MVNKRLMVCLRGVGGKGKSASIKALAVLILSKNPRAKVKFYRPEQPKAWYSKDEFLDLLEEINKWPPNERDICIRINTTDGYRKHIGLNSGGDDSYEIRKYLSRLANNEEDGNCDIIFCASRTRAPTTVAVEKIANKKENGYTLIWTAPYADNTPVQNNPTKFQVELHKLKAKHLMDFVELRRVL